MDILDRARRLEAQLARGMTGAAKSLIRRDAVREPIELTHAIVDAVEREIQPGGRGTRVFPFNAVDVLLVAPSDHARVRLETIVSGHPSLHDRIADRLRAAGCAVEGLRVGLGYVARPQKHWTDAQFGIAFAREPREAPLAPAAEPAPPRLEVRVVHGVAEHRSYAFNAHRIDLGRGGEVRDSRTGLVRTNHVAFPDHAAEVNRTVSRQHAHIAFDRRSGQFRLHDDGSVRGTSIVRQGTTVPVPFGARGVRLQSGDDVVLGEARIRISY